MVFDVTEIPYKIVAKFRDNEIKPLLFPTKIHEVAKAYNNAYVMVEVNDIGEQVANTLQFDLEYENLVMASMRGRAGQVLGAGFSGGRAQLGVRTTKAVKKIGCSNLKQLIEDNKLIVEELRICLVSAVAGVCILTKSHSGSIVLISEKYLAPSSKSSESLFLL